MSILVQTCTTGIMDTLNHTLMNNTTTPQRLPMGNLQPVLRGSDISIPNHSIVSTPANINFFPAQKKRLRFTTTQNSHYQRTTEIQICLNTFRLNNTMCPSPGYCLLKAGLHDQLCRLSPCRQSTADIIGEAFRRQTGDLNKYSCIQLSCSGGEFSVNKLVLCACRPLDLLPFLGEMNVIDVDYSSLRLMFLRCDIDYKALSYQRRSRGRGVRR